MLGNDVDELGACLTGAPGGRHIVLEDGAGVGVKVAELDDDAHGCRSELASVSCYPSWGSSDPTRPGGKTLPFTIQTRSFKRATTMSTDLASRTPSPRRRGAWRPLRHVTRLAHRRGPDVGGTHVGRVADEGKTRTAKVPGIMCSRDSKNPVPTPGSNLLLSVATRPGMRAHHCDSDPVRAETEEAKARHGRDRDREGRKAERKG